jgi:hypothetical protein
MHARFLVGLALVSVVCEASPNVTDLMYRSVRVAEANWAEAPKYSFTRTDAKSKGGSELTRRQYEVSMIDGSPYLRLTSEGGQPLSDAQAKAQEQKYRREVTRREQESQRERQKRIEKYREDRTRDHALLMELCDAFDYTFSGEQRIGDRNVWVLRGKPKPGYVPKNREAKVFAGMEVTFWIDKKTYQWPRLEAEVRTPVSLYGMLGKVYPGTKFVLEQEPFGPKLWLPTRFEMQVKATALGFMNEDSSSEEIYSNYHLGGQAYAASNAPEAASFSDPVKQGENSH